MPSAPTTINTLPPAPDPATPAAVFDNTAYTWSTALASHSTQIDAAAQVTYNNAVEAAASAVTASDASVLATSSKNAAEQAVIAATAVAGAAMWASGSYTTGAVVWSPANGQNYRRKSPGGSSPTDPASDPTNWYALTSLQALAYMRVTADTTAVSGREYGIAASLVLTLPATPIVGDVIEFTNISNTQTATVNPNGQKIRGDSSVMLLDSLTASARLTYSGATDGWV